MKSRTLTPIISVTLLLAAAVAAPQAPSDDRSDLLRKMDEKAQHFSEVSKQIWDFAEVGYKETKSSDLLKSELRKAGFQIQERVGEIPTAFSATWGQGKPVIGILGEFDALPGLSQETVPEQKPRMAGAPGHGCGHNLFGAGSAMAAISVKEYLEQKKVPGTLRFYGTPAEEGGGGKIYMARAGAFSDCEVILSWHPGDRNRASLGSNLANISAKFKFYGKAAHAGGSPDKGRSALDAVMLMGNAVEFLREHVPQETRIHYIITNGGGSPNTVPDFAEMYCYARHPSMPVLDGIWARIIKCAQAGALATETDMKLELVNSSYNVLPNEPLARLIDRNLRRLGGLHYTPEEQAFAQALRKTLPSEDSLPLGSQENVQEIERDVTFASTDMGDVSWIVPTAQLTTATYVPGTPGHSWQSTACTGMTIGQKGMVLAAKTLAITALDVFGDPTQIQAARADFEKRRSGHQYRSRLPADQKPPLNYRDNK
jgi:aminobenzoyl-glutamate utilization protein B